jgi:hypothetical protein
MEQNSSNGRFRQSTRTNWQWIKLPFCLAGMAHRSTRSAAFPREKRDVLGFATKIWATVIERIFIFAHAYNVGESSLKHVITGAVEATSTGDNLNG